MKNKRDKNSPNGENLILKNLKNLLEKIVFLAYLIIEFNHILEEMMGSIFSMLPADGNL